MRLRDLRRRVVDAVDHVAGALDGSFRPRVLPELELDDRLVGRDHELFMVVDPAKHVFVKSSTKNTDCILIWEDLAGVRCEVLYPGVEEVDEVHGLAKVFADRDAAEASDLVGEMD